MDLARTKINWNISDQKNFLVLFGKHLRTESLELVPNGFILKKPVEFETGSYNTYIDIIGIPFRGVYNRVRLNYHRLTLTEFKQRYKVLLGTKSAPMRIKYEGDNEAYLNEIRNAVVKRVRIPATRYIIEEADFNVTPKAYRFKFVIEETEFTDKISGLSVYNDIDCIFYVDDPRVDIKNGHGRIDFIDTVETYTDTFGEASIIFPDFNDFVLQSSGLISLDDQLTYTGYNEDIYSPKDGSVKFGIDSLRMRFKASDYVFNNFSFVSYFFGDNTNIKIDKIKDTNEIIATVSISASRYSYSFNIDYVDKNKTRKYRLDSNVKQTTGYSTPSATKVSLMAYSKAKITDTSISGTSSLSDVFIRTYRKNILSVSSQVKLTKETAMNGGNIISDITKREFRYNGIKTADIVIPISTSVSGSSSISIGDK